MYDSPPDPPEPEDVPEEYSDYLRREIVGVVRAYLVKHRGFEGLKNNDLHLLKDEDSYIKEIARRISDFDEWNKEFKLDRTN